MKAAIISLGSKSSKMTAESMEKYFDSVDMIQLRNIEVTLGKNGGVLYEGEPFPYYDCVFVKGSFRYAPLLRAITAVLKNKIPFLPMPEQSFTVIHNKLLTHLALEQHHVPMPKTYLSSTVEAAKDLLERVNYPIVMKFPEGTQGKGVMFADSLASAASMLDALGALNQPFIIQEYIETGGSDIRALVVGEKVVAAMKRQAKDGELRSNTHSGGMPEAVQLDRQTINIALDTAKALGVDICGVDILQGPVGPVVIEVNLSPGLQGISAVSTINVPDAIAKFLYDKTSAIVSKQKQTAAKEVMKELAIDNGVAQEVIASIQLRGDKIILPEIVNKLARLSDRKDYAIKATKGKIEIKEFTL
ncbi:RimK family alpha-L-glutamate ligase [Candidatus Woesearchaeota archaeon]|jgi:ribosomal protein S6--L-glutamate ligase|nr:RimK family alpha-L-glutamate ligase [Candidatus Woesearchaeota archaeon]MBT5740178.1 RimK family alpha-L-glutamate ligase [Candidatus Woesearchaeota archaeon]MBT6401870.1 RimK family alpha-L-glutamate ligase [Candidatus Woesearchaeota archaeon]